MAPIATVCNNNKMKKLATEAVAQTKEPAITTVSPSAAVEARISEYFLNLEFFHIFFPFSNSMLKCRQK